MNRYWVYILSSEKNGTLYTGVTSNIVKRVYEHKNHLIDGFTKRYNVVRLVHLEEFSDIHQAIHREKCIKRWNRSWKIRLINESNPEWTDLYELYI